MVIKREKGKTECEEEKRLHEWVSGVSGVMS